MTKEETLKILRNTIIPGDMILTNHRAGTANKDLAAVLNFVYDLIRKVSDAPWIHVRKAKNSEESYSIEPPFAKECTLEEFWDEHILIRRAHHLWTKFELKLIDDYWVKNLNGTLYDFGELAAKLGFWTEKIPKNIWSKRWWWLDFGAKCKVCTSGYAALEREGAKVDLFPGLHTERIDPGDMARATSYYDVLEIKDGEVIKGA